MGLHEPCENWRTCSLCSAYFPSDHDAREKYPRLTKLDVVVAAFIVAAIAVVLLLGAHLAPPVQYKPVTYDSGVHAATDPDGQTYTIYLRYDQMNDTQQDDANRFARSFPDGE